jgi:RNA recognition motif-containing protein
MVYFQQKRVFSVFFCQMLEQAKAKSAIVSNLEQYDKKKRKKRVFVGNIPYSITSKDLYREWKNYGIKSISLVKNGKTQHKGFGFITFRNPDNAAAFVRDYHLSIFYGRVLTAEFEKNTPQRKREKKNRQKLIHKNSGSSGSDQIPFVPHDFFRTRVTSFDQIPRRNSMGSLLNYPMFELNGLNQKFSQINFDQSQEQLPIRVTSSDSIEFSSWDDITKTAANVHQRGTPFPIFPLPLMVPVPTPTIPILQYQPYALQTQEPEIFKRDDSDSFYY